MNAWSIDIPNWHPVRLNVLLGSHWAKAARLKRADGAILAHYCRAVPPATGKRRIDLVLTLQPRQRGMDPDAPLKSLLDGLVRCGVLKDDNAQWCAVGSVTFRRGAKMASTIEITEAT